MAPRGLVSAVVWVLLLAPPRAGAADIVRPLRTLSYDCTVSVAASRETPSDTYVSHVERMPRGGSMTSSSPSGSGESDDTRKIEVKGSISVEVLSATDDAGLVVDVAENAAERTRIKVRMVVGPDGALAYDPANEQNVTEEEIAVVRWLARGFYGDHPRVAGTAWTNDQSANGRVDVERYRVLSQDRDRVTLEYALDEKAAGVTGYDASRRGSLVYDTALIVPVKASFQSSSRRQIGPTMSTLRSTITLTLTADSFARPGPSQSSSF